MRSWIGGNAEGRRTFPPKKMFKGYSNFMVFWSRKMEVWFWEAIIQKQQRLPLCWGTRGSGKGATPFSNGIEARGAGFTASSFWVAGVKYTFVLDYEGISVFGWWLYTWRLFWLLIFHLNICACFKQVVWEHQKMTYLPITLEGCLRPWEAAEHVERRKSGLGLQLPSGLRDRFIQGWLFVLWYIFLARSFSAVFVFHSGFCLQNKGRCISAEIFLFSSFQLCSIWFFV